MSRERLVTLPNAVSMSRLVLAAAFVALRRRRSIRFALLAGRVGARTFSTGGSRAGEHSTTRSGALIDPIADRLFVFDRRVRRTSSRARSRTGAYFTLFSRDIATLIGFFVARSVPWLRAVEFRARWLGKLVTALQLLTLMAVIVAPAVVPSLVLVVGGGVGRIDRGLHAHAVARARDVTSRRARGC